MAFGFTSVSTESILKAIGTYRNQGIFALFLLEEAYQCSNITANIAYMRQEWATAYSISTYAISDCVNLCNLCKNDLLTGILYPTNLGYLSFFRAEILSFMEIRNRVLESSGIISISDHHIGNSDMIARLKTYMNTDQADDIYLKENESTGKYEISSLSADGVFNNDKTWENISKWESELKKNEVYQ